jgi:hypothetical protein
MLTLIRQTVSHYRIIEKLCSGSQHICSQTLNRGLARIVTAYVLRLGHVSPEAEMPNARWRFSRLCTASLALLFVSHPFGCGSVSSTDL